MERLRQRGEALERAFGVVLCFGEGGVLMPVLVAMTIHARPISPWVQKRNHVGKDLPGKSGERHGGGAEGSETAILCVREWDSEMRA